MIQTRQRCGVGAAHGKLILMGEHSVVYGMPAIALPFPLLKAEATVEENAGQILFYSDYYEGPLDGVPKKLRGIAICIYETLKQLNKPAYGLVIRLQSNIPIGRGLGSSAAIAMAIVRGIFAFYREKLRPKVLMSLVHAAETYAHGTPSGIDMAAAFSQFPIWFQKGETQSLSLGGTLFLVVADTGHFADTRGAVLSVKDKVSSEPEKLERTLSQLRTITYEAREALYDGDMKLVGDLFNFAQSGLVELGVSNKDINRLVDAARRAGALGAKLTGAGRGGCILALADNLANAKNIARTLMQAGASNTWHFTVEESNKMETEIRK
jgi:mevalonate kinase